jgi:hypothetical protein
LANGIIEELERGKANLLRLSGLMIKRLKIQTIQRMGQNNNKKPRVNGAFTAFFISSYGYY